MIRRLLVANRGEIAVRVIRGARELGIETVAVYSDADRQALHVRSADRAVAIGPPPARDSYLNVEAVLEAARTTGCDALHPGYGFLAESADFAEACAAAGLIFVGPPAAAMRALGDKKRARALAEKAGLPVVPGYSGATDDVKTLTERGRAVGFPLLVKASAGGGGKGMRKVDRIEDLPEALASARREAEAAFGDGMLLLERYLDPVRHVEIQIIADAHGNVVSFGERDCSLQRRHQKIVEEAPSPAVGPELRMRMGEAAVALARSAGYRSAGTVEFMLDGDGHFYFLEVNTRLQVEHPVTELITGYDLVQMMLREAVGEPLRVHKRQIAPRGHAIEARIYAEDPENGFLPSPGPILFARMPAGPGIRVDAGIATGCEVSVHYDPILAKVVAHHEDREGAIRRLRRALGETIILGVRTNLPFLQAVLAHPEFERGAANTRTVERSFEGWQAMTAPPPPAVLAAAAFAEMAGPKQTSGSKPGEAAAYSPWNGPEFRIGESA
jgi:3-methylcrotonyl-CoA carboxylase alpha subunit